LLPIAGFFDPAAGVRKHTDIDAIPVHHVKILSMIESVKTNTAHIVPRLRDEVEKFAGKRVKMSIDDHDGSLPR
jgi:hypothetical protein